MKSENGSAIKWSLIGLFGGLLLFTGDMLLYFTPGAYEAPSWFADFGAYVRIMAGFPPARIIAGALIGPAGAFFVCAGLRMLRYAFSNEREWIFKALYGFLCFGFVFGGAYHSVFGAMGLAAITGGPALSAVQNMAVVMAVASFALIGFGYFIAAALILFGKTRWPRWFAPLTPVALFWIPFQALPQPLRIVFDGGRASLMASVFFAAAAAFWYFEGKRGR